MAEVLEDMICAAQHDANNSKGFLGAIPFGRKIYRPVDGIENLWFSNLSTTNCLSDMGQDACCLNIPVKLMNFDSDPGDYIMIHREDIWETMALVIIKYIN